MPLTYTRPDYTMPQSVPLRAKGQGNEIDRLFARRVFNTPAVFKSGGHSFSAVLLNPTYRSTMCAGDPLNRKDQACGGSNQVSNAVRGMANAAARNRSAGAVPTNNCGETTQWRKAGTALSFTTSKSENPIWSGNADYVADSSSFTRFRKNVATNNNYYDVSFGGDQSSASQVALRRVRRG